MRVAAEHQIPRVLFEPLLAIGIVAEHYGRR
jgi:hypothetical protein